MLRFPENEMGKGLGSAKIILLNLVGYLKLYRKRDARNGSNVISRLGVGKCKMVGEACFSDTRAI